MCWIKFVLPLAMGVSLATAATATEPQPSAPGVQRQRMAMQDFPVRRRFGGFSGGKNWNRSRGTPPDNSTIPTPLNRNPKGRPYSPYPNFPKNI